MWRSYLAAFLLVAVVLGGFAAQSYAVGAAEEIASLIPASLESAQADESLERAYALYLKKTPLLSTLYVHSSLEEIDEAFEAWPWGSQRITGDKPAAWLICCAACLKPTG